MPVLCKPAVGERHCGRAYTLMDLLVGVAFLMVLGTVALPFLTRSGRHGCHACPINCSNNLKQIGLSFRQWALDNQDKFPMQVPTNQGGTMELVISGTAWIHFS